MYIYMYIVYVIIDSRIVKNIFAANQGGTGSPWQ